MDIEWKDFANLPGTARVWIYGFENNLSSEVKNKVSETLATFIPTWTSHQHRVTAAFTLVVNRFAIVAAYTSDGMSGCSIDSLWRNIRGLEVNDELNPLDGSLLFFRDRNSQIQAVNREKFQQLVSSGDIKNNTPVFDTLIENVGQLRAGKFERAFENCWHINMFNCEPNSTVKTAS